MICTGMILAVRSLLHPSRRAFLSLPWFWRTQGRLYMNHIRYLLSMHCILLGYSFQPRPGGGGGDTLDFKWQGWSNGGKIKTQKYPWTKISPPKNPMPNFWAIKIYLRNYAARICGNYHESSDCFWIPEKMPTQINTSQNFPTQEHPEFENFKPQNIRW